ncbi:MAG: hypothetical protein ACLTMP_14805 [Eggerthella lenta]
MRGMRVRYFGRCGEDRRDAEALALRGRAAEVCVVARHRSGESVDASAVERGCG